MTSTGAGTTWTTTPGENDVDNESNDDNDIYQEYHLGETAAPSSWMGDEVGDISRTSHFSVIICLFVRS